MKDLAYQPSNPDSLISKSNSKISCAGIQCVLYIFNFSILTKSMRSKFSFLESDIDGAVVILCKVQLISGDIRKVYIVIFFFT